MLRKLLRTEYAGADVFLMYQQFTHVQQHTDLWQGELPLTLSVQFAKTRTLQIEPRVP